LPSWPDYLSAASLGRDVFAVLSSSGGFVHLSPKVLAISAHTIFKLEQTAGAALNDALLRQIVDNLRRHPKTARQSVG